MMSLKNYLKSLSLASLLLSCCPGLRAQDKPRILIYAKPGPNAHASIPDGVKAVQKIALENNFIADTTSKASVFTEDNLKNYAALVFVSTSAGSLNNAQKAEFVRYIQAGGGFAGIHAASTGGRGWPWFVQLVGAVFASHPEPKEGILVNEDSGNPISKPFPERLTWKDEWYNFTDIQDGLHVVLSADEASYVGGEHGKNHPIAWYREFDGGRTFYTAIGHFSYHYTDVLFVKHLEAGIKYVMGNHVKLDYSKASMPKYSGN